MIFSSRINQKNHGEIAWYNTKISKIHSLSKITFSHLFFSFFLFLSFFSEKQISLYFLAISQINPYEFCDECLHEFFFEYITYFSALFYRMVWHYGYLLRILPWHVFVAFLFFTIVSTRNDWWDVFWWTSQEIAMIKFNIIYCKYF